MLYFDRIGGSKGIDVSNTLALRAGIICHYSYFFR